MISQVQILESLISSQLSLGKKSKKETQLKNIKNKWKILKITSKKRLTSDLYIHHAINHTIKKEHYLQSANRK